MPDGTKDGCDRDKPSPLPPPNQTQTYSRYSRDGPLDQIKTNVCHVGYQFWRKALDGLLGGNNVHNVYYQSINQSINQSVNQLITLRLWLGKWVLQKEKKRIEERKTCLTRTRHTNITGSLIDWLTARSTGRSCGTGLVWFGPCKGPEVSDLRRGCCVWDLIAWLVIANERFGAL